MALDKEKKKEILLQTFDVLKNNIYNNAFELRQIIEKVAGLDLNMAFEMWKYILQNYPRYDYKYNETSYITGWVVDDFARLIGSDKISKFVFNDQAVRNKLYNESASVDHHVVSFFIDINQLDKANTLLELVYTNQNFLRADEEDQFGEYLYALIRLYCKNITEDKVEFIISWAEKVPSKEARAKINLELLDYM